MISKKFKIVVTSRTFSNQNVLKKELLSVFPNTVFNKNNSFYSKKEIINFIYDADAIILGLEKIDRYILKRLINLKMIAKFGVGLDNLDIKTANEMGIKIGWTGGVNKRSVSEQTLGFMLGLSRNLFSTYFNLKKSNWIKDGGNLLSSKCIGIIGCGNIGTDLINLLQPFKCKILISDIIDKKEVLKNFGAKQVPLNELISTADIVSLHVPSTKKTRFMVNEKFLEKMKPSGYLINTSRGNIVEQSALKKALKNNLIAGAALDVFEFEPPKDIEFISLPNLIVTPHIGGNANESVLEMGRSAIFHLKNYFSNE